MFAGTIGDCAGSDPSETQAAARPSHNVLSLRHTKKDRIFTLALVTGWDSTFMILMRFIYIIFGYCVKCSKQLYSRHSCVPAAGM